MLKAFRRLTWTSAILSSLFTFDANAIVCFEVYKGDNSKISNQYGTRTYTNTANYNGALALDERYTGNDCDARGAASSDTLQTNEMLTVGTGPRDDVDAVIAPNNSNVDLSNYVGGNNTESFNIVLNTNVSIPNEAIITLEFPAGVEIKDSLAEISLHVLNRSGTNNMFTSIAGLINYQINNDTNSGYSRYILQVNTDVYELPSGMYRNDAIPAGTRLVLSGSTSEIKPIEFDFTLAQHGELGLEVKDVRNTVGLILSAIVGRTNFLKRIEDDSDGDYMSDAFESAYVLDPFDAADANQDLDNDGLTNLQEYRNGSNPALQDTDNDGVLDGVDPLPINERRWTLTDSDRDGWTDDIEESFSLLDSKLPNDVWSDEDQDGMPLVLEVLEQSNETVKDNLVITNKRHGVLQAFVDTYSMGQLQAALDESIVDPIAMTSSTEFERRLAQLGVRDGYNAPYSMVELYEDLLLNEHSDFELMGFIGRAFLACFNRSSGANGIRYYRRMLSTGRISKTQMINAFVNSNEFKTRFGDSLTNEQFVTLVYQNVLNRAPAQAGLESWSTQLRTGAITRAELMHRFIDSTEFVLEHNKEQKIRSLGAIMLGRDLTPSERSQYVTWYKAENDGLKSVLKALLSSEAYHLRHQDSIDLSLDTDDDQRPDVIEYALGTNVTTADNIFYINSYYQTDARDTVLQIYRDLKGELFSYDTLNTAVNRISIYYWFDQWLIDSGILESNEFKNKEPVARLFMSTFLRHPNYNALKVWQGKYENGTSLKAIANVFANTTEFNNRYGALTDDEFIDQVYLNLIGRVPSENGKQTWLNKLTAGTSRGALIAVLSETAANKARLANKLSVVVLYHYLVEDTITQERLDDLIASIEVYGLIDVVGSVLYYAYNYRTNWVSLDL